MAIQTMVEALPQMEVEAVEIIEEDEQLSIGRLMIAIKKAESVTELKQIYEANKHKVETNPFVKQELKTKKNELISTK